MPSYSFDLQLKGAVSVKADSIESAKQQLNEYIDTLTVDFGRMNGQTIFVEVSLAEDPELQQDGGN